MRLERPSPMPGYHKSMGQALLPAFLGPFQALLIIVHPYLFFLILACSKFCSTRIFTNFAINS